MNQTNYLVFLIAALILILSCKNEKNFTSPVTTGADYMGMKSCQPCHQKLYELFTKSGMGHSFYLPNSQPWIEQFPTKPIYDPHADLYYLPFLADSQLFIQEFRLNKNLKDTLLSNTWKVHWIVGSGRQTRSYIIESNGYLYEAPITWYSAKKIWDLSPGYHEGQNSGFRRPLNEECIFCHNGWSQFSEGSINHFSKLAHSIDCERCHGPGKRHIQFMSDTLNFNVQTDTSILNPKNISIEQNFDICQQCHLQGILIRKNAKNIYDFRPGMRLNDIYEVFTVSSSEEDAFGIASHAERLKKSACYKKSLRMLCTTCHDPHEPTNLIKAANACIQCHHSPSIADCSLPQAQHQGKSCVNCHLHKGETSDIPHVQFTDHYIRIISNKPPKLTENQKHEIKLFCQTHAQPSRNLQYQATWNYLETRSFNAELLQQLQMEWKQDLSMEYVRFLLAQKKPQQALEILQKMPTHTLYEKVWQNIYSAEAFEQLHNLPRAIQHYNKAYELQPYQVQARNKAIKLNLQLNYSIENLHVAKEEWRKLHQKAPIEWEILLNLANTYIEMAQPDSAIHFYNVALKVYPNCLPCLQGLKKAFLQLGDEKAQAEIQNRILHTQQLKDRAQ